MTITKDQIELDFAVGEFDESFSPPPLKSVIVLAKHDLKRAVDHTQQELLTFAERIKRINIEAQLGIENIDKLLIWGDN